MAKLNIKNRTIFCRDNLDIMRGINSDSVDLIYLDPPFNKKKVFTAPIGSHAEGASFRDYFQQKDLNDEWVLTIEEDNEKLHNFLTGVKNIDGRNSYNYCYLCYMAIRVIECRRLLKDSGSLHLHCDQTMSHYLKILMDCIFGEKNFKNEIAWCYAGPSTGKIKKFPSKRDMVLYYTKSSTYTFNSDDVRIPYKALHMGPGSEKGRWKNKGVADAEGRRRYTERGRLPFDWWDDIPSGGHISVKERIGYPTQKPLALLDRIIRASSRKGDVVLDPFCGCATTCIAAEKLGRKWVGIDVSVMAYELIKQRAAKEIQKDLWDAKTVNFSTTPPARTDRGRGAVERKFVYVISNPQHKGYYKVGVAANAQNRLNSYQTGDPARKYKLEFSLQMSNYRETEKHIHNKFENNHEWVRANLSDIIKAIKIYAKK